MRNIVVAALVFAAFATEARADLELPAPSPKATVSQRVGLTDVNVEYSSPGVKGRKIWGALVPFDKPWRTGANASTKITFSKDVKVGGKPISAGTYSIVTHPTAKGWTLAFNTDPTIFAGGTYDAKKDVLRIPLTTAEIPHRERMTFIFSDTTPDSARLDLEWEKLRLSFVIDADTKKQVAESIEKETGNAWRVYANAARYLADNGGDLKAALQYVDKSIAISPTWFNQWIRADILKKQGNVAEARKAAQASWDLGQKDKGFFFRSNVEAALKEWK